VNLVLDRINTTDAPCQEGGGNSLPLPAPATRRSDRAHAAHSAAPLQAHSVVIVLADCCLKPVRSILSYTLARKNRYSLHCQKKRSVDHDSHDEHHPHMNQQRPPIKWWPERGERSGGWIRSILSSIDHRKSIYQALLMIAWID